MKNQLIKSLLISFFVIIGFFSFRSPTFASFATSFDNVPRELSGTECFIKTRLKKDGSSSVYDYYTICKDSDMCYILALSSGHLRYSVDTYTVAGNYYWNGSAWVNDMNTTMEAFADTVVLGSDPTVDYLSSCDLRGKSNYTTPYTEGLYGLPNPLYINQSTIAVSRNYMPSEPIEQASGFTYFIEYESPPKNGTVLLVSREKCWLPLSNPSSLMQPVQCPEGPSMFIEYSVFNGVRNSASEDTHNYDLFASGAPSDYCSNIVSSNYTITDANGNPLCRASVNPRIAEIAPPFEGVISFDPANQDWGAFEWFEDPVSLFVGIINDIVGWFYDLYVGFLNVVVPNPETLTWFSGSIRSIANEKFGSIDLTSLSALQDVSASSMSNITIFWRGTTMTLINFDLLKANIDIIRPILVASVGLFIIIFNVNMLNKLLSDDDITTV